MHTWNRYRDHDNEGYIRSDLKLGNVMLSWFETSGRLYLFFAGKELYLGGIHKRRLDALVRRCAEALSAATCLDEAAAIIEVDLDQDTEKA